MALDMSVALKINAGVQGEQSIDRLNTKLTQLGKSGELSAKQLAQAYRQLPAQFQDIAVSLAGGQNPLMVLLQQGSQISTQFGGMGAAIRSVTGLLTPARLAFGGVATALTAMGVAAFQGYREMVQLQRQLAITGNFAGMTAASFERAAARIQQSSGATAAATREILMGAAGSGAFGPASIEAVSTAMTRLQRLTGQSTEEVVKMFSGMSKGVADWAYTANKSYNFLSVEQYRYIRGLEEQGRQEQAMLVAAQALDQSLQGRTVQLGYLERAWKAVANTASNAWNAMMNLGREDTIDQQIAELEAYIKNADALRNGMRQRGQNVPDDSPELRAAREQLEALRETARLQQRAADATAERARSNQVAIQAERDAETERGRLAREAESAEKRRRELIQGLRDDIVQLRDGEDALFLAQAQRIQGITPQEIAQIQQLLAERAKIKQMDDELNEATKEANRLRDEAIKKQRELRAEGKKLFDETRTPAERLNIELARLNDLLQRGVIDWDVYSRAVFKAQDEFDKVAEKGDEAMKELKRAVEGWGRSAADAFVDFAFGAKASFSDLVNSILKDIARMMIYQNITKPLFDVISASMPKFFANGGIMTSSGPLPLKQYAAGGIANTPQMAVFGEGRMPEAYVPLPDGRTIPVTMTGDAGGSTSVVVNVNVESGQTQVTDQGAGALGKVIASAVRSELINQKRPGGLLAA